jgi:putative Mg2+ transporter-C (MgtC) family protein
MASTFITIVAIKSVHFLGTKEISSVLIAIVVSMGFLGGGMIYRIQEQDIVIRGLTSAAALLMVAVIGIGFGEGLFIEASLATLMCFIVLILLRIIEFQIGLKKDHVKVQKSNK